MPDKYLFVVAPYRIFCLFALYSYFSVYLTKFSLHSFQARADILRIHSRKMNLTRGINLRKIAESMPGASGAEIKVFNDCMRNGA